MRIAITARVLREAGLRNQVAAAVAAIAKPSAAALAKGIRRLFRQKPDSEWRDHLEATARELADEAPAPPRLRDSAAFFRGEELPTEQLKMRCQAGAT